MIKVQRGAAPIGFANQSSLWDQELQQQTNTATHFWNSVRQRKNMKQYAQELAERFHHKCCFCEARPIHVAAVQIEHFWPKSESQFQERMFDWENWLLACPFCNSNKGSYCDICDQQPCLINPAIDDPADHVEFLEVQILARTTRGTITINRIRLNRSDLLRERQQWLMTINTLLLLCCYIEPVRDTARKLLIWALQDDAPYTALTRSYLKKWAPKLANPVIPHLPIQPDNPLDTMQKIIERHQQQLQELM